MKFTCVHFLTRLEEDDLNIYQLFLTTDVAPEGSDVSFRDCDEYAQFVIENRFPSIPF